MQLKNLVRASMFAALAVGLGFSLVLVPNVEFITLIIFLSGVSLGKRWGIIVGVTAEFIFSAMNPMGSGLMFPPLLVSQVFSMAIVGAVGGMLKPFLFKRILSRRHIIILAVSGFILTFIYSSLTTLSFPISAGYEWKQIGAIYISGLLFTWIHLVTNTFVFIVAGAKVIPRLAE